MFKAIVLEETDGKVEATLQELADARLPSFESGGEEAGKGGAGVTVAVEYTTLNYKDGMILNGLGRLVRRYPHVPGIDFAGTVEASGHPDYKPGDKVILTGWRVGEATWGGHAQKARVRGDWLVPLPEGLTAKHAMALGTAGFTAMLAVMALEEIGFGFMRRVVLAGQDDDLLAVADDTAGLFVRLHPRGHAAGAQDTGDYQPDEDSLHLCLSCSQYSTCGCSANLVEIAAPTSRMATIVALLRASSLLPSSALP